MILVVYTLLVLTRVCCAAQSQPHVKQQALSQNNYFNWTEIQPSTRLRWHKCYESYECTRLEVPLDWTNSSNKNKVVLALNRVPAVVDRKDPSFGGTILLNPGGPSGSGVDLIRWQGYGMRDIVDSEKHFEVLSWDPRGVQHSTPSVACFGDDWSREIWTFKNWAVGLLDSSDSAFDVKWAASESFGQLCNSSKIGLFPDGSNIRQFVSTALNARDMVAIIDALEKEKDDKEEVFEHGPVQQPIREHSKKPALLNYWGYSYGTQLGNTFASMFPNRIGRMILDGNVDPVDYSRTGWLTNLFDNNKTLDWFFQYCLESGSKCAFNDGKASQVADLKFKMWTLLDRLKHDPVPAMFEGTADIVSYPDLARLIHVDLYSPRYTWVDLAQVAADLYERNATSMIKYLQHLELPQDPKVRAVSRNKQDDEPNNKTTAFPPSYPHGMEAAHSILCGDGEPIKLMTKGEWKTRLSILKDQSPIVGPTWAEITFLCQHWPDSLRPAERNRFVGPFKSKLEDYDSRASPLLFIGNTADPVTPARNAFKNSAEHEGSRVLIQNSPGHCTGYVNPSECTFQVVKKFFSKGELPEEGKVCEGFRNPFES